MNKERSTEGKEIKELYNHLLKNKEKISTEKFEDLKEDLEKSLFKAYSEDSISDEFFVKYSQKIREIKKEETEKKVKKESQEKIKHCPNCGSPNKEDSLFCGNCRYNFSKKAKKTKRNILNELFKIKKRSLVTLFAIIIVVGTCISIPHQKEAPTTPLSPTTLPPPTSPPTTTPVSTTPKPTTAPTTAPATTIVPTTPKPTTTPPSTTTPPEHITLTGEMNKSLGDKKLGVTVLSVFKSDYGGYCVEVFFENLTEGEILWNPAEIRVIDSNDDSYKNRAEYSYVKSGSKDPKEGFRDYFTDAVILNPDESFRLVLEFPTGMYLLKTFIFTNEYIDGTTTTWKIHLKL